MAVFLVPPFDLKPPVEAGGPWKLAVDVGVEEPNGFACDISADEVRVSFMDDRARQPVSCVLPPEVPRMDPNGVHCKFSSRKRQLIITWEEETSSATLRQENPVATVSLATRSGQENGQGMSLEEVDAQIDTLRRECNSAAQKFEKLADCNPQQRTADPLDKNDRKLVQTLAAQIVRLNRELPDAGSEYLTEVIDTALGASGKASDEAERAQLLLEIGHTLGPERGELQVHCYEKAAINLSAKCDEEPNRRVVIGLAEALL